MIQMCLIYMGDTETMANGNDDRMKLRRRSRRLYPRWRQDLRHIGFDFNRVWRRVRRVPELLRCASFTNM